VVQGGAPRELYWGAPRAKQLLRRAVRELVGELLGDLFGVAVGSSYRWEGE